MTWALVILTALAAFALVLALRAPRKGWEAVGAALLLGIAGYAFQASPDVAGAPKPAAQQAEKSGAALIEARRVLAETPNSGQGLNRWLVIGDALSRNGQYGDAAGVILGAVEKEPKNADAWLALGNALTGHADGTLTPAALYAYRRAAQADPGHPGPPFFLGLALAQSGKLPEGRALWADLLARSPADAPWRADLAARLERLDAFMAMQAARGEAQPNR
ncbi:MAG: tetratricopeptide repeat protein [Novosphingobium sp.]|jgi:cytochrome c-type biogenesis protein CcmH|nr:tetratricopeptide repeat protein [Brevundimonas sp.]MCZ8321702.1 tetratricopeptide repeat protein [Novosphingobium sp.]